MRRTLLALALIASLGTLAVRPWAAEAAVGHTGVCAVTSYTVSGSFNRLSGATTFSVSASGSCLGPSTSVVVSLGFASVGSWSCSGGVALGGGYITGNGGSNQFVNATLTNTAGEYYIEVHALNGTAAAGQFTTLPIACDLGQTQTTIPGTGTLTFTA